jgi:hypothetical protein
VAVGVLCDGHDRTLARDRPGPVLCDHGSDLRIASSSIAHPLWFAAPVEATEDEESLTVLFHVAEDVHGRARIQASEQSVTVWRGRPGDLQRPMRLCALPCPIERIGSRHLDREPRSGTHPEEAPDHRLARGLLALGAARPPGLPHAGAYPMLEACRRGHDGGGPEGGIWLGRSVSSLTHVRLHAACVLRDRRGLLLRRPLVA